MLARTIMVQGTASHVGKSVLVAALCRIFYQDGYRVAPFKSQNMALNSFVTRDGGEMGRAQVVQAEAAGIEPHVDMNPILLKPTGQASSQVIVLGRPVGNLSAREYHNGYAQMAWEVICQALDRLRRRYEIVAIEGAGSPAEVNLQATEIVNMRVARLAEAPVLLAADIDKGGALAAVVGTLELLPEEDRRRVAGIIINKFRGDLKLFQPAVDFLEAKTGIPVVGVVPYFEGFRVQEEDTVSEESLRRSRTSSRGEVEIAVIHLPHISNFTDFDPLEDEPDVNLRYIGKGTPLGHPDLIILPGSKNTIEDLVSLKRWGLAGEICRLAREGVPVIGICGGFQMLGKELADPYHTESSIPRIEGLGLLDISTSFEPEKVTTQVEATVTGRGPLLSPARGQRVVGYEIHMGRTQLGSGAVPAFHIHRRSGETVDCPDGAQDEQGLVFGTYIHGLFDDDGFRRQLLNALRLRKGLAPLEQGGTSHLEQRERDYDRLAAVVRGSLDMGRIYQLLGLPGPKAKGPMAGAV
ncbi:cobyric acid synthase [Desulfofundulus thermosubterraneus]|uniref:Cobyric acid synthase n=1 Tax=Desulfofundulus thermosubterraneus DSM 16057 TaxID=1121432 RepID=A0A1M6B9Z4_9FIRM|nr:cobyric acid synthase [Desulfofundulus thermosubterraneus]SHI45487.1 adenosylcobyric acid synthase (glutamine-hydrolysing) [Desulfofundulus thermosubterraneus DSM 16057]